MRVPLWAALALAAAPAWGAEPVALRFAAQLDGRPFACGQPPAPLGAAATPVQVADFRFYLHDVALIASDGQAVPVSLEETPWQHRGVALLDFEDGTGPCAGAGNRPVNTALRGTAPPGDYVGLRFTLGVPAALNHADATLAPSPLNLTAMFWNWQNGYRFLKLDLAAPDEAPAGHGRGGFALHLGATQCAAEAPTQPGRDCRSPNRVVVELRGFDPRRAAVVVDPAPVLAGADLSRNTPGTPPGCMSFPGDPECRTLLPALGLPYDGAAAGAQRLFHPPAR